MEEDRSVGPVFFLASTTLFVMPALCRASPSFFLGSNKDVDGRDKPRP
jgi:hypothetical protein